ncbi:hypothetical protein [Devosia aurantiaca]|uniref:ATP-grasp domain-containing protein n=1 Tax=Devosia aurantiaca TaxID=2714858 RepID=A0A6M1SFB8_9HYPH|nr:hypothetical protein [Devosia aurantiaca]NGP18559.1 hypothetical protein [Devosia aurantiaca]
MITFLSTRSHRHHIEHVSEELGKQLFRVRTYDWLLWRKVLPLGTWIFTDCERLSCWELEITCRYATALEKAGARLINDPRTFLPRGSLLKALLRTQINSFSVWRPVDGEQATRFPVFLRTESAHRGALSELLHSQPEIDRELSRLVAQGFPLRDLLIVEFRAQELAELPGAFRKHAAFMVGDELIAGPPVTDTTWHAKFGAPGVATEEHYLADREDSESMPHKDTLRRGFEIAGVSFGRMDYAIVNGVPEIYEINTNPHIRALTKHHSKVRLETVAASNRSVVEAVRVLDRPSPQARIDVDLPRLARSWKSRLQFSRWQP